jgi:hypothetical protein
MERESSDIAAINELFTLTLTQEYKSKDDNKQSHVKTFFKSGMQ